MTTPPKKTVAVGVTAVIIAILPALFTYLENRQQIRAKYDQTQHEASLGYEALASSVKELQKATLEQHDYIVKMRAQLELMEKLLLTPRRVSVGVGSGSAATPALPPTAAVHLPELPDRPAYNRVPEDFGAAQMKR